MEMKAFAEMICGEVRKGLGKGACVEVREIGKNNGTVLHGLLARKEGRNVSPAVYLETYLEDYESGAALGPIIQNVTGICREALDREPVDMGFLRSFERVRDRICYRLVGRKKNGALLEGIPYIEFLDLAFCFYYAYNGELGDGTIQISNAHMEMWDSNTMELFALSKRNTPRLFPWECSGLQDILEDMAGLDGDGAASKDVAEALQKEVPMMVLSNTARLHGAVCMLYPGVLAGMADRVGGDLFILPSSIHEVILLPDTGNEDGEALKLMVQEVNSTAVAPEEVLSDTLYRYDRARGRVRIA